MIHSTFVLGWLWYNYWSNIDGKMNLFHSTFVLGQLITFTFNYKILLSLLYLCHLLCDKIYWTKSIWPTKVLPNLRISYHPSHPDYPCKREKHPNHHSIALLLTILANHYRFWWVKAELLGYPLITCIYKWPKLTLWCSAEGRSFRSGD